MIKKCQSTTEKHLKKLINIKRKILKIEIHPKKVPFYEKKIVIVMFIAF